MGLSFSSGPVLAMRRFPRTGVGPVYTSVWLRRPTGSWTIYADAPAELSCARYFGAALQNAVQCPVAVAWTGDTTLRVAVGGDVDLTWELEWGTTAVPRAMSPLVGALPAPGRDRVQGLPGGLPQGVGFRTGVRSARVALGFAVYALALGTVLVLTGAIVFSSRGRWLLLALMVLIEIVFVLAFRRLARLARNRRLGQ